jgi:hypothetical protein
MNADKEDSYCCKCYIRSIMKQFIEMNFEYQPSKNPNGFIEEMSSSSVDMEVLQ